ncbi:vicilin Cor a 11.0101-like [Nymphaea colorata]|nr:vicilin Cor a 11.0101-like [Nymphaea colorata]
MASRTLLVFFMVVSLSLVLLLPSFVSSERDPQSECKQRCHREYEDESQRQMCEHHCEESGQEKCERQCRRAGSDERQQQECRRLCEGGAGAGRNSDRDCWEKCRREGEDEEQRRRCQLQCREEEERRQQGGRSGSGEGMLKEGEGEEETENPYVWKKESFTPRYTSEEGFMRTLPNFAERSEMLKGLENYRVSWSMVSPNIVVAPHHSDADSIIYVYSGKGTIGMVKEGKQELFNVKEGDIMLIPAGSLILTAATDENENLCVLNLAHTTSIPGRSKGFFGIGRKDQESFFKSFSPEILEAAFNTKTDRLMGLLERQKRVTEKATREQMEELRRASSDGIFRIWPLSILFCKDQPYSLLNKRPWFSSSRGQIYQAGSRDYAPLHNHDLSISFAKICAGSMLAPSYNSRATKIAIIIRGRGYMEMACPHVSESQGHRGGGGGSGGEEEERSSERGRGEEEQHTSRVRVDEGGKEDEEQGARYQRISAELSPMTVFVAPAGHPLAIVADEDLHILCFETNSGFNHKYMVAGKNNIFSNMKGVTSELAFGVPSRESQQMLGAQSESVILAAPKQRPSGRAEESSRGYESA